MGTLTLVLDVGASERFFAGCASCLNDVKWGLGLKVAALLRVRHGDSSVRQPLASGSMWVQGAPCLDGHDVVAGVYVEDGACDAGGEGAGEE